MQGSGFPSLSIGQQDAALLGQGLATAKEPQGAKNLTHLVLQLKDAKLRNDRHLWELTTQELRSAHAAEKARLEAANAKKVYTLQQENLEKTRELLVLEDKLGRRDKSDAMIAESVRLVKEGKFTQALVNFSAFADVGEDRQNAFRYAVGLAMLKVVNKDPAFLSKNPQLAAALQEIVGIRGTFSELDLFEAAKRAWGLRPSPEEVEKAQGGTSGGTGATVQPQSALPTGGQAQGAPTSPFLPMPSMQAPGLGRDAYNEMRQPGEGASVYNQFRPNLDTYLRPSVVQQMPTLPEALIAAGQTRKYPPPGMQRMPVPQETGEAAVVPQETGQDAGVDEELRRFREFRSAREGREVTTDPNRPGATKQTTAIAEFEYLTKELGLSDDQALSIAFNITDPKVAKTVANEFAEMKQLIDQQVTDGVITPEEGEVSKKRYLQEGILGLKDPSPADIPLTDQILDKYSITDPNGELMYHLGILLANQKDRFEEMSFKTVDHMLRGRQFSEVSSADRLLTASYLDKILQTALPTGEQDEKLRLGIYQMVHHMPYILDGLNRLEEMGETGLLAEITAKTLNIFGESGNPEAQKIIAYIETTMNNWLRVQSGATIGENEIKALKAAMPGVGKSITLNKALAQGLTDWLSVAITARYKDDIGETWGEEIANWRLANLQRAQKNFGIDDTFKGEVTYIYEDTEAWQLAPEDEKQFAAESVIYVALERILTDENAGWSVADFRDTADAPEAVKKKYPNVKTKSDVVKSILWDAITYNIGQSQYQILKDNLDSLILDVFNDDKVIERLLERFEESLTEGG